MLIHFTVTVQGPGAAEPRARRMAVRAGDVRELLETRDGNETYLERDNGEPVFVRAPFDSVFNLVNDAESVDVLEAAADTPDPLAPRCSQDPEGNHELRLVPAADNPDPDPTAPAKPLPDEVDVAHMIEGLARTLQAKGVVEREKMESILAECRAHADRAKQHDEGACAAADRAQEGADTFNAAVVQAGLKLDDTLAACDVRVATTREYVDKAFEHQLAAGRYEGAAREHATTAKQANVAAKGHETKPADTP